MSVLSFVPLYLAGVTGVAIVVGYGVLKGSGRYGLVMLAAPLALVPGLVGWWLALTRYVNGFAGLETESARNTDVESIVLAANRAAQSGQVASLAVLVLVLSLAVMLLISRPSGSPPVGSALWASGLIGTTVFCVAGYVVLVWTATPTIVAALSASMPTDWVTSVSLADPASPLNEAGLATISSAASQIDFVRPDGSSDFEALTSWIWLRIVSAIAGVFALLFVSATAFAAGLLLFRFWSPTFSRPFLGLSLLMIIVLIAFTCWQIQGHERIEYEASRASEMLMLHGLKSYLTAPPPLPPPPRPPTVSPPLPPPLR